MTSDRIPALGFDACGTLRGKDEFGPIGARRSKLLPNLHFDLIDTYVSPDSVVVFYQNERGAKICEYLRLRCDGQDQARFGESSGALEVTVTAVIAAKAKQSSTPRLLRIDVRLGILDCPHLVCLAASEVRRMPGSSSGNDGDCGDACANTAHPHMRQELPMKIPASPFTVTDWSQVPSDDASRRNR